MLRPSLAALAALLLVACSSGGDSGSGEPRSPGATAVASADSCSPARAHDPGTSARALGAGAAARGYLLHVPPQYAGATRLPLVLALHGLSSDAASLAAYGGLPEAADEHGFVLVLPEGAGTPSRWNTVGAITSEFDDVAFLSALLDSVAEELCIDAGRTYAIGYSNGGGMVQRLACDVPGRLAAVAVVAGAYVSCAAQVPFIAFHGAADPIVPYEGGPAALGPFQVTLPNVRRTLSEWAAELGCDRLALISRVSPEVELSTFARCRAGDGEALLYAVIGGGHTWPGAEPAPFLGMTTQQIDATARIWEFFEAHAP
jgi:polyhydroxybutyrate depolymerase